MVIWWISTVVNAFIAPKLATIDGFGVSEITTACVVGLIAITVIADQIYWYMCVCVCVAHYYVGLFWSVYCLIFFCMAICIVICFLNILYFLCLI